MHKLKIVALAFTVLISGLVVSEVADAGFFARRRARVMRRIERRGNTHSPRYARLDYRQQAYLSRVHARSYGAGSGSHGSGSYSYAPQQEVVYVQYGSGSAGSFYKGSSGTSGSYVPASYAPVAYHSAPQQVYRAEVVNSCPPGSACYRP